MKIFGIFIVFYVVQVVGHFVFLAVEPDYFENKREFLKSLSPLYYPLLVVKAFKSLK